MMETNGTPVLTTSIEEVEEVPTEVISPKEPVVELSTSGPGTNTTTVQVNASANGIDGATHEDSADDDLPPHKLTIEVTSDSRDDLPGPEVEYEAEPPELTISVLESDQSVMDSSHEISSLEVEDSVEEAKVVHQETKTKANNQNTKRIGTRNAKAKQEQEARDEEEDNENDPSTQNENGTNDSSATVNTTTSAAATEVLSSSSSTGRKERKKRKTRSELDRLLMDEGTVKILMGPKPRSASPSGSPASKKEKLSELQKNRDMVINQVRDSSKTKLFSKVSLRLKSKNRRQQQKEAKDGKKAAEGPSSKIIRRRSSSSNFNFSSRSPSPLHMSAPLQSSAEDLVQVRISDSVGYITIDAEAITFNTQTSSRLTSILNSLKLDETVTVVQVSTTCDYFIQGLDIEGIRSETDDSLRESMADSMIACLDTLLKTLINYPKLLVAGVNGDAVDFGVMILGYFDLVYASDKATFQTNYGKNGYLPECLQLFPKNRLTHAMMYTGKKLTATEGLTSGLVTEVLWPAKFQEELASRIRAIVSSNQEVLLQTKLELNAKNSSKLELTRDLRSSWLRF